MEDSGSPSMTSKHEDTAPKWQVSFKPEDLYGAQVVDPDSGKCLTFAQRLTRLPKRALLWFIRFYQRAVSPLFPRTCRFVPSCSQYAVVAITRYGFRKGGWLALKRLAKCGPWHPGGYDPVP